jgi:hypothetical protein
MTRKHPWRFTGARDAQGQALEFFSGVPARDLTAEDVAALGDAEYALVEASGLYQLAGAAKTAPVKQEDAGGN